jgi:hypothetical protein
MDATSQAPATGLRTIRAAGVAGLIFAGTMTTSLVLLRIDPIVLADLPDDTSAAQVGDAALVAIYLIPFSGIAFTWFLAALRRRVGRLEDQLFATVFLATGLLFVAMLFAAGAAASAAVTAERFSTTAAGSIALLFGASLAKSLFYVFAVKMAGAFMLVSSTIGRRTGALPRWFTLLGFAAGLIMLFSVGFYEPLALIFPSWVAIVSVFLLRAHPDTWRNDEPGRQATPGAG